MRLILKICFFLLSFSILFAAYDVQQKKDAVYAIHEATHEKNWSKAELLLRDYLRNEIDLDKSWYAWLMLITVSHKTPIYPEVLLTYLTDMLNDYGDDAEKKKFILGQIALVKDTYGSIEDSIAAWEKYALQRHLSPKESFQAYKRLLNLYFARGDFAAAEEVLHNCLVLDIPKEDAAFCKYNLADLYAGKGQLEQANSYIVDVLDAELDVYFMAQAAFLYADMLEQQKKYEDALRYFELAKEHYGNDAVIEQRIAAVKKLGKIK